MDLDDNEEEDDDDEVVVDGNTFSRSDFRLKSGLRDRIYSKIEAN